MSAPRRLLAVALLALGPAFAGEFRADFAGPLASPWRARQGIWKIADGAAHGTKDPASKHPAKLDLLLPQRDGTLEFAFRTDVAGGVDLFFNRGDIRLAVVELRASGVAFATYPKTKAVPSEPTYLARSAAGLAPGAWHAVRVERAGDTLRVRCEGGPALDVTGTGLAGEETTWMFNLRGPPGLNFSLARVRATPAP